MHLHHKCSIGPDLYSNAALGPELVFLPANGNDNKTQGLVHCMHAVFDFHGPGDEVGFLRRTDFCQPE